MAKNLTEDAVRDLARDILGLVDSDAARAGVGQLTTFNQLGFAGVADKPDEMGDTQRFHMGQHRPTDIS